MSDLHFTREALEAQDGKTVPLTAYPGGPVIGKAILKFDQASGNLGVEAQVTDPKILELFSPKLDIPHIFKER